MSYLYHGRSPHFRGAILYPLNQLAAVYPDLAAREQAKYVGREEVMRTRIPVLDVLWNAVLHCAPIHPHHVFHALQEAGGAPDPARQWFKIPVARLGSLPTLILYRPETPQPAEHRILPEDLTPFVAETYAELTRLPERTQAYFREQLRAGKRPLLFWGVPHVLVHGALDVTGVEVIEWGTPLV